MGERRIRQQRSWRLARHCEALRQPCSLRHRRASAVDARRRTCDCYETGSLEKQQLGCSVVAGWLRLCVCAATSRRGRVGRGCEAASERLPVGAWHKGTGNSVALRNSGLWNMQRMHVKGEQAVVCADAGRVDRHSEARQGWLRAVFQSVVPGESRHAFWYALGESG